MGSISYMKFNVSISEFPGNIKHDTLSQLLHQDDSKYNNYASITLI